MSFPRYTKYKESGVEWLGQVPEHWSSIRYKNVFAEKDSVVGSTYPAGSISYGRVVFKDDAFLHEPTKASYQEVMAGEFLINTINLNYDLKSLRTALSDINTRVSPAYIVLKAKAASDHNYLKHQLHVFDLYHMKTLGAGVRQTITFGDIGGCFTVLPPLPEQTVIAEFLDRETAKIDGLITEQERLIELLKEKRQAVISHAVTKGLNPDAPMRDSGIEWLGQVPEHWAVERGRFLFRKLDTPPEPEDGVVTAFRDGQVTLRENRRTEGFTLAFLEVGYQRVREGDLVIHGMDAFAGAIGVSESTGKCTPEYSVMTPARPGIDNRYFARILRLMAQRNYVFVICPSVRERAPRFRFEAFKDIPLPVPPLEEQQKIIHLIESVITETNILAAEAQKAIALLQERRSALISAAVTGQIDVRPLLDKQAA